MTQNFYIIPTTKSSVKSLFIKNIIEVSDFQQIRQCVKICNYSLKFQFWRNNHDAMQKKTPICQDGCPYTII